MKLAEALQERADLNRNIEQLRARLVNNAIVQENEKPAEDPKALIRELDSSVERLEELMHRINRTNCATVSDGRTITELIARKDALRVKISVYKDLVANASQTARRARMTEIKILSTVDVKKLQKQIDDMSKELRITDNTIQSLNWSTELL
ncbi:DIP1984 family protein [Ruminococcus flavefaciens]|uniref:DIP1984 family protein n=1 Tax=Ruminococcus flavefaciens TaxID=1265 RepID=UPI00048D823D|nr:DIP1984 family protein [Ruminococcus flavefaciens]